MSSGHAEEPEHQDSPDRMIAEPRPFFSIGVTTYDRRDLLKETIFSLLSQTFTNFEVIVGNDNHQETLSGALLGINDKRVYYVNRPFNLGEVANMKDLLEKSRGQYFTWLADDDLYAPVFLETIHKALIRYDHLSVIFTSYEAGTDYGDKRMFISPAECRIWTGSEFLKAYLSKSIIAIGCYGVFRKEYLQQIGGIEKLGHGFSPYSDNWLVIKTGLLDQVGYINSPLLFFRTHEKSISFTSPDVDAYLSAQKDLLLKSYDLLLSESLRADFSDNMFSLLAWCIRDFGAVIRRSRSISMKQVREYIAFLNKYLTKLNLSKDYLKIFLMLVRTAVVVVYDMARKRVRIRTAFTDINKKGVF
jgi:glycosyltransferase involved in cell wall biosynthesis